jgi:alpha-ketoglutarate-dependent 2,4-dichlorophenoxyacetate dioxygenase
LGIEFSADLWRQWGLVSWDNRTTMHRARRHNDLTAVRDMRRTTIRGDGVTTARIAEAA